MVFEGLHPIYDEKARSQLDLAIYIDARMFFRGWLFGSSQDQACNRFVNLISAAATAVAAVAAVAATVAAKVAAAAAAGQAAVSSVSITEGVT